MRNSSLVEQSWADNERDSSVTPKLRIQEAWCLVGGRGALNLRRSRTGTSGGADSSAYAGMSNDKQGENPCRRKPKVSWGR